MPHVRQKDREDLRNWLTATSRAIPADLSYVHESTWHEYLLDRVREANQRDEAQDANTTCKPG